MRGLGEPGANGSRGEGALIGQQQGRHPGRGGDMSVDYQGLGQLPGVWPEGMKVPPRNEFSLVVSEHSAPGSVHLRCSGAPCCAPGVGGPGLKR